MEDFLRHMQGKANNNSITINGGALFNSSVIAGYEKVGNVSSNTVFIDKTGSVGTKVGAVFSNWLINSEQNSNFAVTKNIVTFKDNTEVTENVFGGFIIQGIGSAGGAGEGDGNTVIIIGGIANIATVTSEKLIGKIGQRNIRKEQPICL